VTRKHLDLASFANTVPSAREFDSVREKDILKSSSPWHGEFVVKREKFYANVIRHRCDGLSDSEVVVVQ
jgi:hypothetical protein